MNQTIDILILGAGESGVGAALLAKRNGMSCLVSEAGSGKASFIQELEQAGIAYETEGHTKALKCLPKVLVKSPGIPNEADIVQAFAQKGIPVWSEVEFAFRQMTKGKITGITGTNGKTTTTHLVYHIYKKAGLQVAMGGNVGTSFARILATQEPKDHYVLELSSFQLDNIQRMRINTALLLNISPDHLDRYEGSVERYADAKFNIFKNQQSGDIRIWDANDPLLLEGQHRNHTQSLAGQDLTFGNEGTPGVSAWANHTHMHLVENTQTLDMLISDMALKGKHNIRNSMAAALAARAQDIRKETIREALSDFQQIEHRLEFVGKVKGMEFINDSKATNVNATWYALECTEGPIIWIAGGVDKGNDYTSLQPLVKERVRAIICLGLNNEPLRQAFAHLVPEFLETSSMMEAVRAAYYMGSKNDTVLLSPACASFDLFQNYEDRGRQFKQSVREL